MAKIYTKSGDSGTTGIGSGGRVSKTDIRVSTNGDVDELNSLLGVVLASGISDVSREMLTTIQQDLLHLGSDVAFPLDSKSRKAIQAIQSETIQQLESWIDRVDASLPPLRVFILPGGTSASAHLHLARAVCRRAERAAVTLHEREKINELILVYLNRLSDLLFVLARSENMQIDSSST